MSKRAFDQYVEDARQHYLDEEEQKTRELDRRFKAQERVHALELAEAAERHEKVRESAERAALLYMLEYEQQLKEQEAFERQAIAEAEHNLRLQEASNRQRQRETEIQAAEAAAKRAAQEAEEKKRHEEKLAEAAAKQEQQKQQIASATSTREDGPSNGVEAPKEPSQHASKHSAPSVSQPSNTTNNASGQTQPDSNSSQLESRQLSTLKSSDAQAVHKQYLELHQHLKKMRKFIVDHGLKDKAFKTKIGDSRRSIRQILSTLSMESRANVESRKRLANLLREAAASQALMLDGTSFILRPLPPEFDKSQAQIPGALLYLLNIFAKRVVAQFLALADTKTEWAEPVGIMASSIFAARDFTMQGVSFIDMLIAKYHKACPILFGVKLDPTMRKPSAPFLTAMGAGFAALALRDYKKSPLQNPFPPTNFWTAVARIVNTPRAQVTDSHMILLRAMLEAGAARFINFFGHAALVAIKKAIVDFPRDVPIPIASNQLATLQSILEKKLKLNINELQLSK